VNQASTETNQVMVQRKPGLLKPFSVIQRYSLAVFSVSIALGLALLVDRYHVRDVEAPLFLFAIALTAWYAGAGPAALAFAL